MISKQDIEKVLKTVIDPELGYDIIALGLVYKIDINPVKHDPAIQRSNDPTNIVITMTLTSPGCPLTPFFVTSVTQVVSIAANIPPEQVSVQITFDPPWSPEAMSEDMRLNLGL